MFLKDQVVLEGLRIFCIIGIYDWERNKKQAVDIDLRFPINVHRASRTDSIIDATDYKTIAKSTIAFVGKSKFQLLETLAENLSSFLIQKHGLERIFLKVSKPEAIRGSKNVGVEIFRTSSSNLNDLVYFSLGSNLFPSFNIKHALRLLDEKYGVEESSSIYETSPVGAKHAQPPYWNMVVSVRTNDTPATIRQWIHRSEKEFGRVRRKNRFAPRTLDIDLIFWRDQIIRTKELRLPHPDITKKAFVLFPLLEIAPRLILPDTGLSLIEYASLFKDKTQVIKRLKCDVSKLVQNNN